MFKKRQMRSKGYYFDKEPGQEQSGRNEIKSSQQLLKVNIIK